MTILSDRQILERLGDSVIIEPFNPANVNTSSYDVTLGEWYYIEHKPAWWRRLFSRQVYNIWDRDHVECVWGEPVHSRLAEEVLPRRYGIWRWVGIRPTDRVILVPPKHSILAHTKEFIGGRASSIPVLAPSTTMMKARSSFGRNFIEVCRCAGYGDVGYTNRWTMEITNNSRFYHIPLVVGRRIAQIVFMETGLLADRGQDYTVTGKYQQRSNIDDLVATWRPEMMLPRLDWDRDISK